jgi:hypothetical protein
MSGQRLYIPTLTGDGGHVEQPPAPHASTHAEEGTDALSLADLPASIATKTEVASKVDLASSDWRTFAGIVPWDAQWQTAKAGALAHTRTAKVVFYGDSYVAGQSSGTVTDCLRYGFVGRLRTYLAEALGAYAEGYTIASVAPGNLTSPSSPYSEVGAHTVYDGGVGQVWAFNTTSESTPQAAISCPLHAVTGAAPTKVDVLTVDFNVHKWGYKKDGGELQKITGEANGVIGNGIMRRTSITLSGNEAHNIQLYNLEANGLFLVGHITYYGTTGVGVMRNGIPGFRAIDFATGGGATAGSGARAGNGSSATPDHIIPWAGLGPSSTPPNANITAACAEGYPCNGTDLLVMHLAGNECTYGGGLQAMIKALARIIHAFRRSGPASSGSPGTSILILGAPYFSPYADNQSTGAIGYEWQKYKDALRQLAITYNCGWLDLETLWGETPVGRGYATEGEVHPTQSTAANWGTDGHSAIAAAIAGVI